MDFEPSAEQQMLIDQVRRYVREEIIPLEAKLDPDAAELDPADQARLVEKTKAMGLYGIDIPKEFGGPDIDIVTRVLLAIEMAQHRAGLYVALLRHLRRRRPRPDLRGQRGPEGALPLSDAARREEAVLRPHRAVGRQRSRRAPSRPRPSARTTAGC